MENRSSKIQSFTDLEAWKQGHKIVLAIYTMTKDFPKDEIFGLVSQMRRCAVSITSNIVEGFGRQTFKEKIQFYFIARGSVVELQNQLLVAKDVGYMPKNEFIETSDQTVKVHKILNGLIKSSKVFAA